MPFISIAGVGLMRAPLLLPRDGTVEADERHWQALEARGVVYEPGGIKYTRKAHPASYRPDIPLRLTSSYKALCTLTKDEKALLAKREVIVFYR
jgi:hypothetical protein